MSETQTKQIFLTMAVAISGLLSWIINFELMVFVMLVYIVMIVSATYSEK